MDKPFEEDISPKVKLFYGFKDARAELRVIAPIGIVVPATIPPATIPKVKGYFDEAYEFGMKPEEERKKVKEPWDREVEVRAKVTFGFPDGHVLLSVRPVKISPWLSTVITWEELREGKKVMDKVYLWHQLPDFVREMQGAA
jgi:hypothetical protein